MGMGVVVIWEIVFEAEDVIRGVAVTGVLSCFSSRRRHTRCSRDWSSDVCSSDLSSTVTLSPAPARYAAHTSPLCPPPMISASQLPSPRRAVSATAPPARRSPRQDAFRNQLAHAPRETAQAHLAFAQGSAGVAARGHARLYPPDQRLVLETDAPVDAPVQIARGAHLAARVRVHIGDLANQGLGGRYRQELDEGDLVRGDGEGEVRPELEVGPQPLPFETLIREIAYV